MYKPSGGESPPNARETTPLPLENSTWHREPYNRDPRTDRADRDRVGAGKRHWNGERSSNMASFPGVPGGASLSGNGYVPRSKPRFQGHYSGFFTESGRNGPSFSATGPVDTSLVRRYHRNPYPSGTSPAVKSQGFSGSPVVDYRASESEERHTRDQFLPSGDDKDGRDQPLPPHTPQVHSDAPILRNGDRSRPFGSRANWESSPRIDRDNITRPHSSADMYSSSRRRSIVTQFDSGKDWVVGDKRSEVGRFERYGTGSRDGPRADYENSNKDTGFSHGWRRERGSSGGIARHSSFTTGSRNLGEIGGRGSLSVGSALDSLNVTSSSSNQDFDQPSPSKRLRLGWGQGLAKYEKKVGDTDDASPVEKPDTKKDRENDPCPTVEDFDKKRGVEHEKRTVLGWAHESKRDNGEGFIDAHEKQGESEKKSVLMREHGARESNGQDSNSCALLRDSLKRGEEDERKHASAQELQRLEDSPASALGMEDREKILRGNNDQRTAALNDNEELVLNGRSPAPPVSTEDSESRRKDEVTFAVLRDPELLEGKVQNLMPSVLVGEAEREQDDTVKSSAFVENSKEALGGSLQKAASEVESTKEAKSDLIISDTLIKAEWMREGGVCSRSISVTDCKTGGSEIGNAVLSSPTTHLEMIAEDSDVVSPIEASPERSSTGCDNSPRSHVADDSVATTAPLVLAESIALPVSSPIHISTSNCEPSSIQQCAQQDVSDLSMDERPLEDAEGPGQNTPTGIEYPKEILVNSEFRQEPEAPHLLVREEETHLLDPEPVRAMLQTEPAIAQHASSSDPSMSQVREKVVVTANSDPTLPESHPVSEGSLVTDISIVYTCVSEDTKDLKHTVLLEPAKQTDKSILETMARIEAEIDLVKKEIAKIDVIPSGDVSLELCSTDQAAVSVLDSPSKVAEDEDVPTPMEEDTTDTVPCSTDNRALCPSFSPSSPTVVSAKFGKSPICSARDISSTPALHGRMDVGKEISLLRESTITTMPDKGVLEMVPGGILLKSAGLGKDIDVKDIRDVRSGSMSFGSEESDHSENQYGNEVATGSGSLQERTQTMVQSLTMENKEKARLSGASFAHLLPEPPTGKINQQLYHSLLEVPVWQRNVETHKFLHARLLKKLSERHHFTKFKERVLTMRYRALMEAWKREQKGLSDRRNRPKMIGRWDGEGRSGHGPPSQRSSSRLRPLNLGRLDAESDAAQAMKMLMKEPQGEAFRPVLKMPAMILDEKERQVRRFVSRNAVVEDPIAVEMERKTLNPWTAEEKKTFAEKFAVHNKNFKEIALHIEFKTTADCIEYYYRNQKSEEFRKSQHGVQLKNRWDYTKTSATFLTPTAAGIKRNHEANCARIEALNVTNTNMKLFQRSSHLLVSENTNPAIFPSDSSPMPITAEEPKFLLQESKVLEVVIPLGATAETGTSSLISTPCSVSSTAAPVTDKCKEKDSVKERIRSGPSVIRNPHSEHHPAGLKGVRSTHLRRMSSRAAAQEDSQWTDGERELFTNAVATYGKDFRLIASHVGSKSQNQCKAFFSKTRKRLGLDELVEQFQANEAAAMLVQSFRHDVDLAQEVKPISIIEMNASAGVIAEELIDTAAAVSTLESLKEQPRCLPNDMSDLSLVADAAAAVMEEITPVKTECPTLDLFSNSKSLTTSQDLACELLKVNRSTVPSSLINKEDEEDSEATKSDDSYQNCTEAETDIVVDQAAAALVGLSEMVSGLKRSKSEAKVDTKSSPVSVFARSQSARFPTSSPPLHAVTEANLCLTSARTARHTKERVNASTSCRPTARDRSLDMQDAHIGRKGRETAGGEPKPRREPTSWTQEEKEKFAVILQEYGKDWTLLHENLPSKSLTQIKTYFQNSKARSRLPASDKLLNVTRSDSGNRKRKADDYESTRRAAELALPVKQNVRGNVAPPELDITAQKEDNSPGSAGTAGVGVDILAYAARFGTFPGQPVDQDTLSMNGMQHLVRQRVSANSYAQGTHDGHQVFRPGARPALPSPVVTRPPSSGGILQQLSGPGPLKSIGSDLQSLSPGVVPQAGPPAAIQQVAQQVQQMLQQQQHLQKQLTMLIQQQAALPQNLLPQHQQATQQTLQAVRPLEEKLHQVVQQLQQQYELQGRGQAPSQDGEIHSTMHFQHQQTPSARGILKVKPIRGTATKLLDLETSPSSGVFSNKNKSQNEDIQLQQQDHSLSLGIGTIPALTAGSTAGLQENHAKTIELQDSDTDTDCEGMGSRHMLAEDSHQRMSIVHSTSSGQQQGGAAQSTTSTLSSDSEQVKSRDVKLFGQSLLSKPPPLLSNVPRSSMQEFLNPNTSPPAAIMTFPTGTLSKGPLPSAFGRVPSSTTLAEGQPIAWSGKSIGQYGAWSTTSSLQLSGVTELTRKEPDSESALEAVTSVAAQLELQHSDAQVIVLAPQQQQQQVPPGDGNNNEHLDSESGNLSTGQLETPVCDAANENRSQGSLNAANSEADQCQTVQDPIQPASQMSMLSAVVAGHGQWG